MNFETLSLSSISPSGGSDRAQTLSPIHLTGDFAGARIAVKKAFDLDRKFRAKFVKDDDFDGVWDSFGEER